MALLDIRMTRGDRGPILTGEARPPFHLDCSSLDISRSLADLLLNDSLSKASPWPLKIFSIKPPHMLEATAPAYRCPGGDPAFPGYEGFVVCLRVPTH
jgi:hypothetical protein